MDRERLSTKVGSGLKVLRSCGGMGRLCLSSPAATGPSRRSVCPTWFRSRACRSTRRSSKSRDALLCNVIHAPLANIGYSLCPARAQEPSPSLPTVISFKLSTRSTSVFTLRVTLDVLDFPSSRFGTLSFLLLRKVGSSRASQRLWDRGGVVNMCTRQLRLSTSVRRDSLFCPLDSNPANLPFLVLQSVDRNDQLPRSVNEPSAPDQSSLPVLPRHQVGHHVLYPLLDLPSTFKELSIRLRRSWPLRRRPSTDEESTLGICRRDWER